MSRHVSTVYHTLIVLQFALTTPIIAQLVPPKRYWVYFADKPSLNSLTTPDALGISERAMRRRAKSLPNGPLIDGADIPVRSEYKNLLLAQGITIVGESRWLNALSVEAADAQAETMRRLPNVRAVMPVGTVQRSREFPEGSQIMSRLEKANSLGAIDYGTSFGQLNTIAVPPVHALGIIGSGVLVGMIDDGFNNHTLHDALKRARVLKEYDWVQGDSNTSRAPGEYFSQGDHGCFTMSALGGFSNGNLIGPAFGVSFMLAKTEVDSVEIQVELDRYVFALEWMEREGCDVVSTSLGYDDLDPFRTYNAGDIVFALKNGRTAVTSAAASVAARKGLLLVTAMGNEGWARTDTLSFRNPDTVGARIDTVWRTFAGKTGSLITPADADSIVAVGAVYSFGEIAGFSSTGPTADDRIKPEVVAPGVSIKCANPNNLTGYASVGGTSLATPLTAGVAALVLSAHPELSSMQVREALMQTATHPIDSDPSHTALWPNNYYGWGMINAVQAVLYHGLVFSNRPVIRKEIGTTDTLFTISSWIKSNYPFVADSLRIYFKNPADPQFQSQPLQRVTGTDEYFARIPKGIIDTGSLCYLVARDSSGKRRTSPYNAPDSLFRVQPTPDSILSFLPESGVPPIALQYKLFQNYPNPFNSETKIEFVLPQSEPLDISVYDILGRRIRTLFKGMGTAGRGSAIWNGRVVSGEPAASGLYFYRLQTPSTVLSGKMLLIK